MSRIVHARIDRETERILNALKLQLGWTNSKAIREGIKALDGLVLRGKARRVVGLGRFCSGLRDLGSNKQRLRGFGT
jgi:hypothetical protein